MEVPAPSRMKFSGGMRSSAGWGRPGRSSFWPVGTVNREVIRGVPPVSLVEGRAVSDGAFVDVRCALAGMEARTSWWALVSTMMRRGSSPGASSTSRSEGSSRPRSRVPRVPVAGPSGGWRRCSVGDCDGAVGQFGQAEGVLHAGGVGVAVDKPKSNRPLPTAEDPCTPLSVKVRCGAGRWFRTTTQRLPSRASMMPEAGRTRRRRAVGETLHAGAGEDADGPGDGFCRRRAGGSPPWR